MLTKEQCEDGYGTTSQRTISMVYHNHIEAEPSWDSDRERAQRFLDDQPAQRLAWELEKKALERAFACLESAR